MMINVNQFNFPSKVFRGPDALNSLGVFCKTLGQRAFVLGGITALSKTQETIYASLSQNGIQAVATEWYGGECTQSVIRQQTQKVVTAQADVIIAVGGGKALDTGKAVAAASQLPLITVPTIAATCAAVTPLSVIYNEKGEFVGNHFLEDCPAGTIIDTTIICEAPSTWLCAGIGDTLAKMYELRAASLAIPSNSVTISAVINGQICYNIIKRFGSAARKSVENKKHSSELDSTVDAIILSAGLSSIFGGEKLRNAAAHAIYNGLTKIPAAHKTAHGLIVGYGNLCLLALEGRPDNEIIEEIKLADSCAIPTRLNQIVTLSESEIQTVAQASSRATAMSCMPFAVSAEMVIDAIRRVDSLSAQCSNQ